MNSIYISFGSNLGNKLNNINNALDLIKHKLKVLDYKISSIYETEPVGFVSSNSFYNGIIKIKIHSISPEKLLEVLKEIEHKMGRENSLSGQYLDRPIDLDIIMFDNKIINLPQLKIPHPKFKERLFVLVPLLEIEPEILDPESKQSVKTILRNGSLPNQTIKKIP